MSVGVERTRSTDSSPQSLTTIVRSLLGITIPIASLTFFFQVMAAQLSGGRSIADVFVHESKYGSDRELRQICAAVGPRLRNGATLGTSLAPHAHRFPELVIAVLQVGEVSGGMADSAKRLADTFNQMLAFERQFRLKAFDKRVYLVILCLIYLISLILGEISAINLHHTLSDVAEGIAVKVAVMAVKLSLLFTLGRAILLRLYSWESLRLIVDTILLALPRIGLVYRNLAAARWARSFAVLWGAGINISTALEVSSRSALNAHYERTLQLAATQTRMGWPLSKTLTNTHLLPPFLLQTILACETVGRLDDQLLAMAAHMEQDALARAAEEMNRVVMTGQVVLAVAAFAYSAKIG